MPETACQHKASRLRQSPDEKLRELLRCDATALVIGPHKRTFAETAAHVDETRKTKRWAEVCAVFGEFSKAQGERNQDAGIAAPRGCDSAHDRLHRRRKAAEVLDQDVR